MGAPAVALVMAGGEGTRLRPLTVTVPKPMLPVGSRAILEIVLRQIAAAGVEQVHVSVGYRGYLVKSFLRELDIPGASVTVVEEASPLGTAGPLALLPPTEEPVFVMNGDVLTRAPIRAAIDAHRATGAALTMLVHRHHVPLPYGLVDLDGDRVAGLREKPTLEFHVATGMYVISPEVVGSVAGGCRLDMPDLIARVSADGGDVRAFEFEELWTDVADLADFEKVNLNSSEWEDL